jgi:PAS domain-containing protein
MASSEKRKRGRPKGARTTVPRWPAKVRRHIVNALATWAKPVELYRELTDSAFEATNGFSGLDPEAHGCNTFLKRCSAIPKTELIEAHDAWAATLEDVHWAGMKARAQALSDLIDTVMERIERSGGEDTVHESSKGHINVQTIHEDVAQIRMLMEQVRKEVSADADRAALSASGGRVLIANPKAVEISADTVGEMFLVWREELGGLHNLDLSALSFAELTKLNETVQKAISDKLMSMNEVNSESFVEVDDDEDDDS